MKSIKKFIAVISALFLTLSVRAQNEVEMADTMRSEGKIYVVVGIILIVLVGLIAYLFILDRKVKKLEERLSDKN
jgi:hypothetical protein